jgi:hypothetical protein
MAVSCPWGHKGHLGLLQDPSLYLAQNGAPFDIPATKPPLYPIVPAGTTAHQCKELRAQNTSARKAWTTYRLVRTITCDQFAATINVFYAVLDNQITGLNIVNLRMLVHHIVTTYAQISQPNLNNYLADLNTGIDPGLPLAVYTRTQERCQVFALNAAVHLSKATMVTTVGHNGTFKAGNGMTDRRLVGDSYPRGHVRLKNRHSTWNLRQGRE